MEDEPDSERPREDEPLDDQFYSSFTGGMLKMAEFMSLDSDLRVFNRFNVLRVFVMLRLQHRLATKAAELEKSIRAPRRVDEETLDALALDIERTLKDYDRVFWTQVKLEQLSSPPNDFMTGFIRHCDKSHYSALISDIGADGKKKFRADALVATAAREKTWTHGFIDRHDALKRLFKTKSTSKDASVFIYSESSIRRVEQIFVNISFCLLLICPIIVLSVVESTVGKLAIVLGFLIVGAILTSGILTGANNAGLAVLAGYGAILVFFLGVNLNLPSK